jgi:hypothetical protein
MRSPAPPRARVPARAAEVRSRTSREWMDTDRKSQSSSDAPISVEIGAPSGLLVQYSSCRLRPNLCRRLGRPSRPGIACLRPPTHDWSRDRCRRGLRTRPSKVICQPYATSAPKATTEWTPGSSKRPSGTRTHSGSGFRPRSRRAAFSRITGEGGAVNVRPRGAPGGSDHRALTRRNVAARAAWKLHAGKTVSADWDLVKPPHDPTSRRPGYVVGARLPAGAVRSLAVRPGTGQGRGTPSRAGARVAAPRITAYPPRGRGDATRSGARPTGATEGSLVRHA